MQFLEMLVLHAHMILREMLVHAILRSAGVPLVDRVKGRSIDDVLTIRNSDIAKHLSLPPVKLHCSMLAEDAIKAAVRDIRAKRERLNGSASEEKFKAAAAS
jgi:hypothetical protein